MQVQTPWGPVDGMLAWLAPDSPSYAPEFESCRRIAAQHKVPLRQSSSRRPAGRFSPPRPAERRRNEPANRG